MNISIDGLTKTYGPQRAVDSISFEVKKGEILGFLGPNGAGKTTTMKMITTYLMPDEGKIVVGGKDVQKDAQDVRRLIGYLPEHNPLYTDMPVMEYLAYCASLQEVPKARITDQVRRMVMVCGLDREKHKKINELSKGYRQRVGLAQAMIHDPEILILDEPTTGLDPNQIVEIRELIREIGKEKTVILSTHILPEVEATCDRILIINRGKIVADGTAASLRKQSQGKEVLTVTVEDGEADAIGEALRSVYTVEGVNTLGDNRYEITSLPDLSSKREVFRCIVEKGWVMTEMVASEKKLEDIFRNLTLN
ncbi:MAG: ATP-binding cassette domain-containing protein [Bacteroidia bacterium]